MYNVHKEVMIMNNTQLQSNLIHLRKKKGLTQKDLANALNYSDKVISKWERGESYPNIDALTQIAEYYEVTIDHLVGRNENSNEQASRTLKLDVIKTESPSFIRYLFIVPFAVITMATLFTGSDMAGPSLFIFGIAIIFYSMLLSKATFETTYNDLYLKIINTAFKVKIYANDELINQDHSVLRVNPVIETTYNSMKIKVEFNNITSIKCNIFIEDL